MDLSNGITFIGSGNVAWHLAARFGLANIKVNKVISTTENNASALAAFAHCSHSTQLSAIPSDTALVLICASDNAIEKIAKAIAHLDVFVAHTAASIPLSVFNDHPKAGVLYPFQTFTKGVRQGELEIPFFIEANSEIAIEFLKQLASKVSDKVYLLDSEKRKFLHIAGIMVNNFPNFFYTQAFSFLRQRGVGPEFLMPLIDETVQKLKVTEPEKMQTGPARRGSMEVVESHLSQMDDVPETKAIYNFMSQCIFDYYNKTNE